MRELREQEKKLRLLESRIESEITRFESVLARVEDRQLGLSKEISAKGLEKIPVSIVPHGGEQGSLCGELRAHLSALNDLYAAVSNQLALVEKEASLLEGLKEKYGEKVELRKTGQGEFELEYRDEETESAFQQLKSGKKLAAQLRDALESAEK